MGFSGFSGFGSDCPCTPGPSSGSFHPPLLLGVSPDFPTGLGLPGFPSGTGGVVSLTATDGTPEITLNTASIDTSGGSGSTQGAGASVTFNDAVILAVTISLITGVMSGFAPAYTASKMDPVDSLRYE